MSRIMHLCTMYDFDADDGSSITMKLPGKYAICPRCDGHGSHTNPNVDGHGITEEERERDWDPEEWDSYMNGGYDVPCHGKGCDSGKVIVVDEENLTAEQKVFYEKWQEYMDDCALDEAADRRTRWMEDGCPR